MTYNFTYQLFPGQDIILVTRCDENSHEFGLTFALKDFFECAQAIGLFPEGSNFSPGACRVDWEDEKGSPKTKSRSYAGLMASQRFDDDDIQKICARLFQDEIPQTIYWVCPMSTVIQKLELKGYFNGPLFQMDLLEYAGAAGSTRLIFKDEIGGQTFFTDEIEAKKRLQLNLQTTLMLLNRELIEHLR